MAKQVCGLKDGCCGVCKGTGVDYGSPETNGECWECYGTGHTHLLKEKRKMLRTQTQRAVAAGLLAYIIMCAVLSFTWPGNTWAADWITFGITSVLVPIGVTLLGLILWKVAQWIERGEPSD